MSDSFGNAEILTPRLYKYEYYTIILAVARYFKRVEFNKINVLSFFIEN